MLARSAKTHSPALARMASENRSCSQLPRANLKRSQKPNARQHTCLPATPGVGEACSSKLALGSVLPNFLQGHAQTPPAVRSGDVGLATLCKDYLAQLLTLLLVEREPVEDGGPGGMEAGGESEGCSEEQGRHGSRTRSSHGSESDSP